MARPGFASSAAARRFDAAYERALEAWPPGTERLEVSTDLGHTRVYAAGPEGAPAVLLLPGAGATAMAWWSVAAELARTHRVIIPDVPGQPGRSSVVPEEATGAEAVLGWLDQLIERLDLDGCALCGHSYGAWLSLYYALGSRARCRSVVLVDPTSCFVDPGPWYRLRGAPAYLWPVGSRAVAGFVAWETRGRRLEPRALDVLVAAGSYRSLGTEVPRRPNRQALEVLQTPVLVVAGGRSRQHDVPALCAAAETTGPNVTTVVLPGASHFSLPATDAAALVPELRAFLAAAPAPGG
jgi:pimeloyl-ACP methyl ester carboxylesterase